MRDKIVLLFFVCLFESFRAEAGLFSLSDLRKEQDHEMLTSEDEGMIAPVPTSTQINDTTNGSSQWPGMTGMKQASSHTSAMNGFKLASSHTSNNEEGKNQYVTCPYPFASMIEPCTCKNHRETYEGNTKNIL